MLIYLLEQKRFLVGLIDDVISSLLEKNLQPKKSVIILPCSLHDLALDKNFLYKNVDFYTSDSMFLTYFFRLKLNKKIDRVYGPDLMLKILEKEKLNFSKKKHYFLAPNKATATELKNLLKKHENLKVNFGFLPKSSSYKVETDALQKIIKEKPDFIWLGIGSPKQVELASYLKNHLTNVKIFCVGAAFEFLTKQKKQAPLFLQKSGMEWFFRLISEPKRLWRRYLIIIPKFLFLIFWRKIFFHKKVHKHK